MDNFGKGVALDFAKADLGFTDSFWSPHSCLFPGNLGHESVHSCETFDTDGNRIGKSSWDPPIRNAMTRIRITYRSTSLFSRCVAGRPADERLAARHFDGPGVEGHADDERRLLRQPAGQPSSWRQRLQGDHHDRHAGNEWRADDLQGVPDRIFKPRQLCDRREGKVHQPRSRVSGTNFISTCQDQVGIAVNWCAVNPNWSIWPQLVYCDRFAILVDFAFGKFFRKMPISEQEATAWSRRTKQSLTGTSTSRKPPAAGMAAVSRRGKKCGCTASKTSPTRRTILRAEISPISFRKRRVTDPRTRRTWAKTWTI